MIVRRDLLNIIQNIRQIIRARDTSYDGLQQDCMQICVEDQGVRKKNLCVKQCARDYYRVFSRVLKDKYRGYIHK